MKRNLRTGLYFVRRFLFSRAAVLEAISLGWYVVRVIKVASVAVLPELYHLSCGLTTTGYFCLICRDLVAQLRALYNQPPGP